MYHLAYSASLLLYSFIFSHARSTVFISRDGVHTYLPSSAEPGVCLTPKCVISAADILTSLDESVDPCDDFHRFACGGWLKRQEPPEDQKFINAFTKVKNDLDRKMKELLESKYDSSDPLFVKMLKDFYNSCIDLESINKSGSEPLKRMLSRLGGWPVIQGNEWDESTFDWVHTLISLRKLGYNTKYLMTILVVPKSLSEFVNIILLGPPERTMSISSNLTLGLNDSKTAAYFRLMVKAANLLGADESTAEKEMLEVLNFEIALENLIDEAFEGYTGQTPGYLTVKDLQDKVPQIPWQNYFSGVFNEAIHENQSVVVPELDLVTKIADLVTSSKKRVVANYMMMKVVFESAEFLSREWDSVDEELKKFYFQNEDGMKIRWKKCLSSVTKDMQIALSSYYIRRYFNVDSKDEAIILVKYINKEFLKMLEGNDWMDETTRKKAEEKANALESYVGFPDDLLNDTFMMKMHENLTITTDSYLENVMALRKMATDRELANLGKLSDHKKVVAFKFTVEVNAYYNPAINSMIVPAGILHDVFYDKDIPNYLNFGAIGYVIGHEITHGFDNQGRYYDKDGQEVNWWDEDSDKHFREKVQCIIDQYNNYTTDIGLKVNGERTQNENIADNGAIKEAYWAYNSWTKDNGIEPTLPGLNYTQNQLFWISAARIWCSKYNVEKIKLHILMDIHSPDRFRIIGPMSNLEEFSKDFKCSADSPMNRKYKCQVW